MRVEVMHRRIELMGWERLETHTSWCCNHKDTWEVKRDHRCCCNQNDGMCGDGVIIAVKYVVMVESHEWSWRNQETG